MLIARRDAGIGQQTAGTLSQLAIAAGNAEAGSGGDGLPAGVLTNGTGFGSSLHFSLNQINQSCTVPQNRQPPAGSCGRGGARAGRQRAFPVQKLCRLEENSALLQGPAATSHSPLASYYPGASVSSDAKRGIYEFRGQQQATRKRACTQRVNEHATSAGRIQRPTQPKRPSQYAHATTAGDRT